MLLSEALQNNTEYFLKIIKEQDSNEIKSIQKILLACSYYTRLILIKALSNQQNLSKKNYNVMLNHQNSLLQLGGSNFSTTNNYNNLILQNPIINNFYNIQINQENLILNNLNSNENLKTEFIKRENEIKDRAKSSYGLTNSLEMKDIKKIACEITSNGNQKVSRYYNINKASGNQNKL